MNKGKKAALKGARIEEALRNYFLRAGYFVVRGVPFDYEGYSVTDIDLWLYLRSSSVSREITIVDVKNKRTPQAIERIFWTKGLQAALRVNRAVVATTDLRQEVKDFGKELDVVVLDGRFLSKLETSKSVEMDRLTDEELEAALRDGTLGKLDGDWRARLVDSKARLTQGLSFESANYWLEQAKFFGAQAISRPSQRALALRCFYRVAAYVGIAVDYLLRDLSFVDELKKQERLRDGFTYGDRGRDGMKRTIDTSLALLEQFGDRGKESAGLIRARVDSEFAQLPTAILSEYFGKADVGRGLFDVARELEELAMARSFRDHTEASTSVRAMIGCLLDYWGFDRAAFMLKGPRRAAS